MEESLEGMGHLHTYGGLTTAKAPRVVPAEMALEGVLTDRFKNQGEPEDQVVQLRSFAGSNVGRHGNGDAGYDG